MGNTPTNATDLKKPIKNIEYHPSILSETSIDEKLWINVDEDKFSNLNESFTNERYNLINEDSQREVQAVKAEFQSFMDHVQQNSKQFEWMIDVIEERLLDSRKFEIKKLLRHLYKNSKLSHLMDSNIQRKLVILKRIHLPRNTEKLQDYLLSSKNDTLGESKNGILMVSVLLFMKSLENQINSTLGNIALDSLVSMLKGMDPLVISLRDKMETSLIETTRNWLISTLDKGSPEMKSKALEGIVGLAIGEGSLKNLLSTVALILLPETVKTNSRSRDMILRVVPFLKQLDTWEIELILSPLNREYLSGTWTITFEPNSTSPDIQKRDTVASLTTSSHFLFIHDQFGLSKVDMGIGGTSQGQIVSRIPEFYPNLNGDLAFVQDRIYWRSHLSPRTILVLNAETLKEEGTILSDGTGTICTKNISKFPSFWNFSQDNDENMGVPSQTFTKMFTDGRYLYFLVLLNVHGNYQDKFVVDVFDPLRDMEHVKSVELRYMKIENGAYTPPLLPTASFPLISFYTNGYYLIALIPQSQALFPVFPSPPSSTLFRCFNLRTGFYHSDFSVDLFPKISAVCYEATHNVIWTYGIIGEGSSVGGVEVSRYMNEGVAPRFVFGRRLSERIYSDWRDLDQEQGISSSLVGKVILGLIGKLADESMPSRFEGSHTKKTTTYSKGSQFSVKEPYCVEIDACTFATLHEILKYFQTRILLKNDELEFSVEIVFQCLRILKVNLHRLVVHNIDPKKLGLQQSTDKDLKNSLLDELRDLLLYFLCDIPSPTSSERSLYGTLGIDTNRAVKIQQEACDVLTVGLDVFYPSHLQQSLFLLQLLNMINRKGLTHKGARMLLYSLFTSLAKHKNASYLVLPPADEVIEFGENSPMNLFIPLITRLLKEAQNALVLSNYSPILPFLQAIQKDLLQRSENSVETTITTQALVTYVSIVIDECKSYFSQLRRISKQSDYFQIQQSLDQIRCSVVGILITSLAHSLLLFSHNCWVCRQLLPSIISLIKNIDKVNKFLPFPNYDEKKINSGKQIWEGPSRFSETPHPYGKSMDTHQVIKIEGAVFLSLIFDEKCATDEGDYLQLHLDLQRSMPIGEKYSGDYWPRRRMIVMGDTVVFNFVSSENMKNSSKPWGYRCVVIGNTPWNNKSSLPWSYNVEKTLCYLAGQMAASLVSADTVSKLEFEFNHFLESDLFREGIDDSLLELFFPNQRSMNKPKQKNTVPTEEIEFIEQLCLNEGLGFFFLSWLEHKFIHNPTYLRNQALRRSSWTILTVLLKYMGLVKEARLVAQNIQNSYLTPFENILTDSKNEDVSHISRDDFVIPIISLQDSTGLSFPVIPSTTSTQSVPTPVSGSPKSSSPLSLQSTREPSPRGNFSLSVDIESGMNIGLVDTSDVENSLKRSHSVQQPSRGITTHRRHATDEFGNTQKPTMIVSKSDSSLPTFDSKNDPLSPRADMSELPDSADSASSEEHVEKKFSPKKSQAAKKSLTTPVVQSTTSSNIIFDSPISTKLNQACSSIAKFYHRIMHFLQNQNIQHKNMNSICDSIRSKARFLLAFQQSEEKKTDANSFMELIIDFVLSNTKVEDIIQLLAVRRLRAMNRKTGLKAFLGILSGVSLDSMKYEVLAFLGPSLRKSGGLKHNWPYHYLDHLGGIGPHLIKKVATAFETLMKHNIQNIITQENSDFGLKLIALDTWGINFRKDDLSFLAKVDVFRILFHIMMNSRSSIFQESKETKISRQKLHFASKTIFRILALICIQQTPSITGENRRAEFHPLHQSFFDLIAEQLELVLLASEKNQTHPISILGLSDMTELLSLLYTLSAETSVSQILSSTRFLSIFISLLEISDYRRQRLLIRLFRRILPTVNTPPVIRRFQSESIPLLTILLEILGTLILFSTYDIERPINDIRVKRLIMNLTNTYLSPPTFQNQPGPWHLSHPFAPYFDPNSPPPFGWNTKTDSNIFRITSDSRVATVISIPPETEANDIAGVYVRADKSIGEFYGGDLFYFEVRIEDAGAKKGYVSIGLIDADEEHGLCGIPGCVKYSYGFHGNDGRIFYQGNERKSRSYADEFGVGDVVGCGWNKKEGILFFTKNGQYLGTAFKNISGNFYPAVGMSVEGISVAVNFGQIPFIFDSSSIVKRIHGKQDISKDSWKIGHEAYSLATEVIFLLRYLMNCSPMWKSLIEKMMSTTNLSVFLDTLLISSPTPLQHNIQDNETHDNTLKKPSITSFDITDQADFQVRNTRAETTLHNRSPSNPVLPQIGTANESNVNDVLPTEQKLIEDPKNEKTSTKTDDTELKTETEEKSQKEGTKEEPQPKVAVEPVEPLRQEDAFRTQDKISNVDTSPEVPSQDTSLKNIYMLFAMLAVLGGWEEIWRVGAKITTQTNENGVILDYQPGSSNCIISIQNSIESGEDLENLSFNHTRLLKPHTVPLSFLTLVDEVKLEFSWSALIPKILPMFSLLKDKRNSIFFQQIKSQLLLILLQMFDNEEATMAFIESGYLPFLLDLALSSTVVDSDPNKLLSVSLVIRQRISELNVPKILNSLGINIPKRSPTRNQSAWSGNEELNAHVEETASPRQDKKLLAKEQEVKVVGIEGRPVKWIDEIKGKRLTVSKREDVSDPNSHWVPAMDKTVGKHGSVVEIDRQRQLAKLRFFDPVVGSSEEWWFLISSLVSLEGQLLPGFEEKFTAQDTLPRKSDLLVLSSKVNDDKVIVFARKASLKFLLPPSIQPKKMNLHLSMSQMGGTSKLVSLLKLAFDPYYHIPGSINFIFNYHNIGQFIDSTPYLHHLNYLLNEEIKLRSSTKDKTKSNQIHPPIPHNPTKAGHLAKQGKRFKRARRYWYILGNEFLIYQKSNVAQVPVGWIALRDVISVDETESKEKKVKKEAPQQLTSFNLVTSTRTYHLQAESTEDKNDWVTLIRRQILNLKSLRSANNTNSLVNFIINECMLHLKKDENRPVIYLNESNLWPYNSKRLKQIIKIEGAKQLLVVFDGRCATEPGTNILRFFKDFDGKELIASFTGNGVSQWPITLITGDHFWLSFTTRKKNQEELLPSKIVEWGYSFTVWPVTEARDGLMFPDNSKFSFDFGFLLLQWLFDVNPFWLSEIKDLGTVLTSHLELVYVPSPVSNASKLPTTSPTPTTSFLRRLKIITFLKRLLVTLSKQRGYDKEKFSQMTSIPPAKIEQLSLELNELYKLEKSYGGDHSVYFKRLFELMVFLEMLPKSFPSLSDIHLAELSKKEGLWKKRLSLGDKEKKKIDPPNTARLPDTKEKNTEDKKASTSASKKKIDIQSPLKIEKEKLPSNDELKRISETAPNTPKNRHRETLTQSTSDAELPKKKKDDKDEKDKKRKEEIAKKRDDSTKKKEDKDKKKDDTKKKEEADKKSVKSSATIRGRFNKKTRSGSSSTIPLPNLLKEKMHLKPELEHSWFYSATSNIVVLEKICSGEKLPLSFVQGAYLESRKPMETCESPHPIPRPVRVAATVKIPKAKYLVVTFDPRSKSEANSDYLMFSLHTPGANDLGFWTGDFPKEPILIPGDNFVWSFLTEPMVHTMHWGFRFTVRPHFTDDTLQELISDPNTKEHLNQLISSQYDFSRLMDNSLSQFIQNISRTLQIPTQDLPISLIEKHFSDLCVYPLLSKVPYPAILLRIMILKHFNKLIREITSLIDFSQVLNSTSLAYMIGISRGIIFYDTKNSLLSELLYLTQTNLRRVVLRLDRHKKNKNEGNINLIDNHKTEDNQNKKVKEATETLLFLQVWNNLQFVDPARLRQGDRAWEVKFLNEGAADIGGPYNECLTQICSEMCSPSLGLFCPCPNQVSEMGYNQDKFLPNPGAISPIQLSQFEFIGRLIGIAIRTKHNLDFLLPSIIWKSLIGLRVDRIDLEHINKGLSLYLDTIEGDNLTEDNFNDLIFETFTVKSLDGRIVELVPGGKNIPVTWANRIEFIALVESYHLTAHQIQVKAIYTGLSSIVPVSYLNLFKWEEIEYRVCGHAGIDLDLLKKHTIYRGLKETDNLVLSFWEVLYSFNAEEQILFLRFVWGRSRLPPEFEFNTNFILQCSQRSIPAHLHSPPVDITINMTRKIETDLEPLSEKTEQDTSLFSETIGPKKESSEAHTNVSPNPLSNNMDNEKSNFVETPDLVPINISTSNTFANPIDPIEVNLSGKIEEPLMYAETNKSLSLDHEKNTLDSSLIANKNEEMKDSDTTLQLNLETNNADATRSQQHTRQNSEKSKKYMEDNVEGNNQTNKVEQLKYSSPSRTRTLLNEDNSNRTYPREGNEKNDNREDAIQNYIDSYLPEAQTCFFTLTLPNYSTKQVLRRKLLYAITSCREIDTDFVPPENTPPSLFPFDEDLSSLLE